ncbi:hypothetical protein JCM10296v2_005883 [Rhodotorula toruloides]
MAVPLLAPPPPRFPQRFSSSDGPAFVPSIRSSGLERRETGGSVGRGGDEGKVVWEIKTDSEEHVERLESKLRQLRQQPSSSDSGYVSHPRSFDPPDDLSDVEEAFTVGEDKEVEREALSEAEEEGRPLLSAAREPGVLDSSSQAHTEMLPPNAIDDGPGPSTSQLLPQVPSSRISFNQHADHPAPAPAATERTSLLSAQPRPISTPSDLLVQAVTPSLPPSRSTSPAPPCSRRASMSSSLLSTSSFAHVHSPFPYSSSPTSYGASRSSSPCSSIYAPLQPPSNHCPNPIWVRPAGVGALRRSRSGSSLSFQEFLRNGGRFPDDEMEDSDDDEEYVDPVLEDEPRRLEYRELVEQQRLKKARWEARKRQREAQRRRAESEQDEEEHVTSVWDKLGSLLALGMSGRGSARPSPTLAGGAVDVLRQQHHQRRRPSPLAYASSADEEGQAATRSRRRQPCRQPHPEPALKTEADVRFGPAPGRYFRLDWLVYKLKHLVEAAKRALRTALVGFERSRRQKEEDERPSLVGYGVV